MIGIEPLLAFEPSPDTARHCFLQQANELTLVEIVERRGLGIQAESGNDVVGVLGVHDGNEPERIVDHRIEQGEECEDGDDQREQEPGLRQERYPTAPVEQGRELLVGREVPFASDGPGRGGGHHSYTSRNRLTKRRLSTLRPSVMKNSVSPMAKIEL